MRLNVYYESIDPDYSSHEQVFIGIDEESCYRQKYEYEKWMGIDHSWELLVSAMGIIRWAYVKDLLPKEGKK